MEGEKTQTQEKKEDVKDFVEHIGDFLETYYQLLSINIAQKGINIASAVINAVVLCLLGLFTFGLLSLGLAWWLGNVIGSRPGGFFITAGLYLIIMVVVIVTRKKVIFPFLRNLFTRKIYE